MWGEDMGYSKYIEFVETHEFVKSIQGLLTDSELYAFELHLASNPCAGAVIQGSGGARKIRWGLHGHGKRGGLRVIYYFKSARGVIYLISSYAKNEKDDIPHIELIKIRKFIEGINHE